jgi:hypothetical protein
MNKLCKKFHQKISPLRNSTFETKFKHTTISIKSHFFCQFLPHQFLNVLHYIAIYINYETNNQFMKENKVN